MLEIKQLLMTAFLRGGYNTNYSSKDNDSYEKSCFLVFFILISIVEIVKCKRRYKIANDVLNRCTKKTSAKVTDVNIKDKRVSKDRSGYVIEVETERYYTCKYEIDDVVYTNECILPCTYVMTGKEAFDIGKKYKFGQIETDNDKMTKKNGDLILVCYDPDNPKDFYCVEDEDSIKKMREKAKESIYLCRIFLYLATFFLIMCILVLCSN